MTRSPKPGDAGDEEDADDGAIDVAEADGPGPAVKGAKPARLGEILDTLVALGHARKGKQGWTAV